MTGKYKGMKLFIAPRQSALTLEKRGDVFYITGYIEEEYKPRHPHLFIKKKQALLRLNRLTYFPIVVPDKFAKSIKSSINILASF